MADNNIATYDGTIEPIKKILREADVVIGIWSDLSKRLGVCHLVSRAWTSLSAAPARIRQYPYAIAPSPAAT